MIHNQLSSISLVHAQFSKCEKKVFNSIRKEISCCILLSNFQAFKTQILNVFVYLYLVSHLKIFQLNHSEQLLISKLFLHVKANYFLSFPLLPRLVSYLEWVLQDLQCPNYEYHFIAHLLPLHQ
jgi:hypothetical protein